jgi:hypothetical protein
MDIFKKRWFSRLILLAFIASFTWALLTFGQPRKPEPSSYESLVSKLSEDAEIIRTFVLPDGSYGSSLIEPIAFNWVGMTAAEFTSFNPEWTVISFSSNRVVVEEKCSPNEEVGFVRLENGYLKIFSGEMTGCHKLISTEQLDVNNMPLIQRLELESGIFYAGDELDAVLDGIRAP